MGVARNLLLLGGPPGWLLYYLAGRDEERRRKFFAEWQREYEPEKVLGDAKFADAETLRAAGMFEDRGGVPVGYVNGKPVYHNESTSLITFGQSGIGKGSQSLIPALLQCPKLSFVVPDIDGEAFNCTAEQRSRYGPVYVMDAFGMFPDVLRKIPRAQYNAMDKHWLDPAHPMFGARCTKLGAALVSKGHGRDEYWYLGGRQLTTEVLTMVRKYGRDTSANLTEVAKLIHGDPFRFASWAVRRIGDVDPYLAARLSRWANPDATDIRSLPEVVENTKTQLNFLLDPCVAAALSRSTFNFSQCAERVMTVYILAPHELLDVGVAKYLTTVVSCALGELIRFNPNRRVRTVVMLDEFFELPLEGVDHLLISARKSKTMLWICLQDMAELKDLYRETFETFMNNAGCIQWLGASDMTGSSHLSQMLGQTEVRVQSRNQSWSAAQAFVHDPPTWRELNKLNMSQNDSATARPLMLPQEIRALPADKQILFLRGVPPILAERKSYRDVPRLARIAGKNPWYSTGGNAGASVSQRRALPAPDNWKKLLV